MAKAPPKSIVRGTQGEHCDAMFMMKHDDFRFGGEAYRTITGGQLTQTRIEINNRICKIFLGDDGMRYAIFSDWSARIVA